ncbi:uncharacterized protein LOC110891389 [Helianthus annuus]|uniref:uncharacterized protein LOC110891389 n=1 Tax=Helianthus annuus TaxID=4232 RepID=UPI000B8F190F|nr:uncharacterized protein LOC110891389 [Helianthus annuus]
MLFKSEVDVWDFIFQVFFFLAAITGCISVIVNIKFSEDLLVSDGSNFQANGQECQVRHKLNRLIISLLFLDDPYSLTCSKTMIPSFFKVTFGTWRCFQVEKWGW